MLEIIILGLVKAKALGLVKVVVKVVVKACQNVFSFSLYTEAVKLYHYILH